MVSTAPNFVVFEADKRLFDVPVRLVQSQNPWSMKIYGIWWPDLLNHCLWFGWSVDRKCRWRILLFVWWFLSEPPGRDRCSHLRSLRAPGGGRTQRGHNQIGDCNGWSTIDLAKRVFFHSHFNLNLIGSFSHLSSPSSLQLDEQKTTPLQRSQGVGQAVSFRQR